MNRRDFLEKIQRRINVLGHSLSSGHGSDGKKLTQAQWYRIEGELGAFRDMQRHMNGVDHPPRGCSLCAPGMTVK